MIALPKAVFVDLMSVFSEEFLAITARGRDTITHANLLKMLTLASRQIPQATGTFNPDEKAINHVLNFIKQNYRQPICLAECATRAQLSISRFNVIFKKQVGESPEGATRNSR